MRNAPRQKRKAQHFWPTSKRLIAYLVDATIINAPSSTKNKEGKRDPEMHQTVQ